VLLETAETAQKRSRVSFGVGPWPPYREGAQRLPRAMLPNTPHPVQARSQRSSQQRTSITSATNEIQDGGQGIHDAGRRKVWIDLPDLGTAQAKSGGEVSPEMGLNRFRQACGSGWLAAHDNKRARLSRPRRLTCHGEVLQQSACFDEQNVDGQSVTEPCYPIRTDLVTGRNLG
jgi:hypothetical protein